jgi:succinate dehydrogenase/fumarate reductase flavoprotein subunit
VKRDLKAHAVRADGSVIPGLFVAGETASQYGQGLTIAVVLGRVAGQNAAKEALAAAK